MEPNQKFIYCLQKIIEKYETQKESVFDQILISIKNQDALIYGAGNAGRQIFKHLLENKKPVYAFIDKNADKYSNLYNVPVISLDDISHVSKDVIDNCYVIIALGPSFIHEFFEIKKTLINLGFKTVIYYFYYFHFFMQNRERDDSKIKCGELNFFTQHKVNIFKALQLFQDNRSCEIFIKYLDGFFSWIPSRFATPDNHIQYFPPDIQFRLGYSTFIDCGAYNGDTFLDLIKFKNDVDNYVAFEPDQYLYLSLVKNIMKNKYMCKCFLLPCGVYNRTQILHFMSHDSVSMISSSGDQIIQCVSIDDALFNFSPTFIKMDIEGVEYEAIQGSKETIRVNKPDLAICVYHWADDIWRIPLLINNICPGYRFYLRTYTSMGLETVLYASYGPSDES